MGHAHLCWRGWAHLHSERHNSSTLVTQPTAMAHHVPHACMHSQQPGIERRDSFVQVSQRGGPRSFSGPNPTRPWTDVCLAFRTGQRISGQQGTAAGAPADLSTLTATCTHTEGTASQQTSIVPPAHAAHCCGGCCGCFHVRRAPVLWVLRRPRAARPGSNVHTCRAGACAPWHTSHSSSTTNGMHPAAAAAGHCSCSSDRRRPQASR